MRWKLESSEIENAYIEGERCTDKDTSSVKLLGHVEIYCARVQRVIDNIKRL